MRSPHDRVTVKAILMIKLRIQKSGSCIERNCQLEMFRVKTSQASTVYKLKVLERLVFLVDGSAAKSEAFSRLRNVKK